MGELEHEVVRMELVEEGYELAPAALLDHLSAVVPEAEMHRALGSLAYRVEDSVDRACGHRGVGWAAGNVRLVDLDRGARKVDHLLGELICDREEERLEIAVVAVEKRAREHVRARERELEGAAGDGSRAFTIGEEVERAFLDRAYDDAGGLRSKPH